MDHGKFGVGEFDRLMRSTLAWIKNLLYRWFDSAPDHQETPKPPSGGFFMAVCFGSLAALPSNAMSVFPTNHYQVSSFETLIVQTVTQRLPS